MSTTTIKHSDLKLSSKQDNKVTGDVKAKAKNVTSKTADSKPWYYYLIESPVNLLK